MLGDKDFNKEENYYTLKTPIRMPNGCQEITISNLKNECIDRKPGGEVMTLFMSSGRTLSFTFQFTEGSTAMYPYKLTRSFATSPPRGRDYIARVRFTDHNNILIKPHDGLSFEYSFPTHVKKALPPSLGDVTLFIAGSVIVYSFARVLFRGM